MEHDEVIGDDFEQLHADPVTSTSSAPTQVQARKRKADNATEEGETLQQVEDETERVRMRRGYTILHFFFTPQQIN